MSRSDEVGVTATSPSHSSLQQSDKLSAGSAPSPQATVLTQGVAGVRSAGGEIPDGRQPVSSASPDGSSPLEVATSEEQLLEWQEPLAVILIVCLADFTFYHYCGYASIALFVVIAPLLFWFGRASVVASPTLAFVTALTCLTSLRLWWQGNALLVVIGLMLTVAMAMAALGRQLFPLEFLGWASRAWLDGIDAIRFYCRSIPRDLTLFSKTVSLSWMLPLFAVTLFSGIFVAANPDVIQWLMSTLNTSFIWLNQNLLQLLPDVAEVMFCAVVAWYTLGLIRPADWSNTLEYLMDGVWDDQPTDVAAANRTQAPVSVPTHPLFAAYRNTLASLSVLFGGYLIFEFTTLWFRSFPKGFHYSGYAHEGAAWLTVALALATVILSFLFRGRLLHTARIHELRIWARIWSVLNLILAVAVYNRLLIYVGFNGMTRMRVVGFLGITAVVVGFVLVVWKIERARGFLWLIRRQLLTVTMACWLYLVLPVDWLVYRYNVQRIMAGDPAPSVQLSVHSISPEGLLTLFPLLNCPDVVIRDGVRSLLEFSAIKEKSRDQRWFHHQIVHGRLGERLKAAFPAPDDSVSAAAAREVNWKSFHIYSYQWF